MSTPKVKVVVDVDQNKESKKEKNLFKVNKFITGIFFSEKIFLVIKEFEVNGDRVINLT